MASVATGNGLDQRSYNPVLDEVFGGNELAYSLVQLGTGLGMSASVGKIMASNAAKLAMIKHQGPPSSMCVKQKLKPVSEAEIKATWDGAKGTNEIKGTSYDVVKLIKTQPYTYSEGINAIKESIVTKGYNSVPPIAVRIHNGKALIVDGHHRLEAFKQLGYNRVPIKYISKSKLGKNLFDGTYYRRIDELLAGEKISN